MAAERGNRGPLSQVAVILLASCIVAGFCAVCSLVLWQARVDIQREARVSAENLVTAVEREIARTFESYDLSLQAVVDKIRDPETSRASPRARHMILFDRAASANHLGRMVVLNEAGDVVLDSQFLVPPAANLADREYFTFHGRNATFDLFVSTPFKSRLSGEWSIAISRRLTHPDGSFAGVVVGTIRLSYFRDLFKSLDLRPDGSLALFMNTGEIVMREPLKQLVLGQTLANQSNFKTFTSSAGGSFEGTAGIDGVRRLFTFKRVGDLPLILNLGVSTEAILQPWRRRATAIGFTVLSLCAGAVTLLFLLCREFARRRAVEQELEALATTDPLTGLANRRQFDARLAQEWTRCRRHRRPLTLLLLDADEFKRYNDAFGHQSGDDVLHSMAATIAGSVRETDLAARVGGEEFAVLLPEAKLADARRIAESIRSRFAERKIAHPASAHGIATLSIGVACRIPTGTEQPASLMRAADLALYRAKRDGRNRVAAEEPGRSEVPLLKSA